MGFPLPGEPGRRRDGNVTGYDLCDHARQWLKANNCAHLSLLEAVLTEERFAPIRRHVGRAKVFWSHLQKDPVEGGARDGYISLLAAISCCLYEPSCRIMAKIPKPDQCYFWVDCFCLRQAQAADFNVDAIMELIPKVGTLIGQVDCWRQRIF